jgi:hypothetical protein
MAIFIKPAASMVKKQYLLTPVGTIPALPLSSSALGECPDSGNAVVKDSALVRRLEKSYGDHGPIIGG